MNEDFEKLKAVGAQKIYEKTHIARKNVEYILTKSFDKIPKIQFRGFISILEREYHLNLSDLLDEYKESMADEYDDSIERILDEKEETKSNKKLIYLIFVATVVVGYFIIANMTNGSHEELELNNSQIESAKEHLDLATVELNTSNISDINMTQDVSVVDNNQSQKSLVATRFEIMTKRALWIGYIDMDDLTKKQITIQNSFDLDPSKNYLLVLGHGMLKIDLGIDVKEFNRIGTMYLKFENGELEEITRSEFKKLNKGSTW
ncbi:hypothetical protein KKA17_04355 [bacterium]|nr:hypothetical protein [bacterium]MBU1884948.1 hypothetical protein [bacterium]